ncbi:MAG: VWA domain-containing protein [Deltaproteobacteria bacterium]|nr:VWA domain-containing protein [Deltaproteobacteria bacterium]
MNIMKDELELLKEYFKENPPPEALEASKKEAIQKAVAAFEKKNTSLSQGNLLGDRLKNIFNIFKGGFFMKKAYFVGGALSIAVLTLVFFKFYPDQKSQVGLENYQKDTLTVAGLEASKPQRQEGALSTQSADSSSVLLNKGKEELMVATAPKEAEALVGLAPVVEPSISSRSRESEKKNALFGKLTNQPIDTEVSPYFYEYHDQGRDRFSKVTTNPIKLTQEEAVSTFSIDVDTASYSFVRASLNNNVLPAKDAVRVEELINYFPYDYELPKDRSIPFKASVSVFPTPWNPHTKLLHIGIKGYELQAEEKPKSNLVFLIDTSGSMNAPNKLPLLQNSMKLLVENLSPQDRVAIVTYAGSAGTVLEPTLVKEKSKILNALNRLSSGGSTAGAEGIRQAYQLAEQNFDKDSINRVILATDGDFNVGITNTEELKSFIERKRETGVFLSVLGFGRGNYNDELMQTLAQNGNGQAAYIDNLNEARKLLVQEASSTLFPIAKDVKIQVEFNPAKVAEYRLIGYETRMLKREDFNNDKVDAGEIGAGHTVTAIYEITPVGSPARLLEDSRYQAKPKAEENKSDEYAFLKIRYKLPQEDNSKLITMPIGANQEKDLSQVSQEARFATAVAAFGQLLRGSTYLKNFNYNQVIELAQAAKGKDEFGYRAEFINLVRLAKSAPALENLK